MKRTQKLALGGIFSGLAVVLMFFSNFLPMLNIALPVFAGMVLMPLMIELNWKWTLTSYVVSSLLSLLLVRNLDSLIYDLLYLLCNANACCLIKTCLFVSCKCFSA